MCLYLYFRSKRQSEHIITSSVIWESLVGSKMICDRATEGNTKDILKMSQHTFTPKGGRGTVLLNQVI